MGLKNLNEGIDLLRIWRNVFLILSLMFFGAGMWMMGYNYAYILQGIRLGAGYSTPPSTAFMLGIPFAIVCLICLVVGLLLNKKVKKRGQ